MLYSLDFSKFICTSVNTVVFSLNNTREMLSRFAYHGFYIPYLLEDAAHLHSMHSNC
jgi:hypothetical protein